MFGITSCKPLLAEEVISPSTDKIDLEFWSLDMVSSVFISWSLHGSVTSFMHIDQT